jgi:polyferredoxin
MYTPFFIAVYLIIGVIYILHIYEKRSNNMNNSKKERIEKIRRILYVISIIITLVGVVIYYKIKSKEYNKNFDIIKFIFGSIKCKCIC